MSLVTTPRSRVLQLAALALGLALGAGTARADDFLKSSPGELAASHAAIDHQDQCASCHEPDNSVSAARCLGCHDHADLKKRIDGNEGFHASARVKNRPCKVCHQEHRGRGFDLMGWSSIGGPKVFDHKLAGWELAGKHAVVDCTGCHKTVNKQGLRTYLHTERACASCHTREQPHGAVRPVNLRCERCHGESQWKPQKPAPEFNHDDRGQAAMPLVGTHADVACAKCHPKAAFKLAKFDGSCTQCHQSPHDGQLFGTKKCELCHSPALRSMVEVQFDHKKQTGYALIAKHAQIACEGCHTKALGKQKPAAGCETCHAKDNKHAGRFDKVSTACATCHSQRAWTTGFQFNHQEKTGFDLTGKHAKATCRDCHRGKSPSEFERFDIKNGCMSCHKHGKAHGGKFKNDQCLTCHAEAGNKRMRTDTVAGSARETFHGENSKFPLHGGHATVQCQMCHVNDVYQETPRECGVSCHEDSLHKGSLGQQCSRCHEPGQWPAVRFDHRTQTKWPLEGKHTQVKACESCHPSRRYHGTPTACGASGCHKADDVHQGKLGNKCETCHATDGTLVFRHNRDAQFKIDGKHTPLVCAACHKSVAFKPVRRDCFGCHPEPAIHKGRYGTDCERCHSTRSFGDIRAQHDVGDFSLSGAHDQLTCARCHPSGEKLRGSGNLCITCHKRDDIHGNALSPRCGECHTQRAFAPARFDHVTVGCNLMGLHGTLPCADCHKAGNYGAVSPMCVSCHRGDALRVKQPDHRTLVDCGGCHNPSAWIPATQLGQQSICR
jgi:hypothetical protein